MPDVAAVFRRGASLALEGKYAEAVEEFTRVIHAIPGFAEAYYARGLAHVENGDFDDSMEDCAKAIQLKPDHPWTLEGDGLYFGRPWKYYVASGYAESIAGLFEWDRWHMGRRRLSEPTIPAVSTYGFGVCDRTEDGKVVYDAAATVPPDLFKVAPREEVLWARTGVMGEESAESFLYRAREEGYSNSGCVPEALTCDQRLTYEHTLLVGYFWPDCVGQYQAPGAEVALCRPIDKARIDVFLEELVDLGWLAKADEPQFSEPVYQAVAVMTPRLWPHLKSQWARFLGKHGRMPELFLRAVGEPGGVAFPRNMTLKP